MIAPLHKRKQAAAGTCRAQFFLVLVAGMSVAVNGCTRVSADQVLAVVLSADGSVALERKNEMSSDVKPGTRISIGDKIRTGETGILRVCFLPGILGRVATGSELNVIELAVDKDGNAMEDAMRSTLVRVAIVSGTVDISVGNRSPAQVEAETPIGIFVADSGCLFRVRIEGKRARVLCLRGTLHVNSGEAGAAMIEAGYFREWPSAQTESVAADSDASAQNDVIESLAAERELLALQEKEQGALAPWLRR